MPSILPKTQHLHPSLRTADNDSRSSDPAAPRVAEQANLPDPLVRLAKLGWGAREAPPLPFPNSSHVEARNAA
jgi:hypothetical protein